MEDYGGKIKSRLKNRNFWYTAVFLLFLSFLVFLGKNLAFAADVPNVVTYQGKLLINGSVATTTQSMKFVLYDSLSGGTALYSASGTIGTPLAVSTTVSNGFFTVNLGDTGTNSLDPAIFKNNSAVYLEVIIGAETLTPRKRLTAAPFAFNAKYLDGISATATPQSSVYIPLSDSGGNMQFGGVSSTGLYVANTSTLGSGVMRSNVSSSNYFSSVNLLSNPSFENSSPTSSWDFTNQYQVLSTYSYDGARSVSFSSDSGTQNFQFDQQISNPVATTTISFYGFGQSGGETLHLAVTGGVCPNPALTYLYDFGSSAWTCYDLSSISNVATTTLLHHFTINTSAPNFQRYSQSVGSIPFASSTVVTYLFLIGGGSSYSNQTVILDAFQVQTGSSATAYNNYGNAFTLNAGSFASTSTNDNLLSIRSNDTEKLKLNSSGDLYLNGSLKSFGSASYFATSSFTYLSSDSATITNLSFTNVTSSKLYVSGTSTVNGLVATTSVINTLSVTNLTVSSAMNTLTVGNLTDSSLLSGSVVFAGSGGLVTSSANLYWDNVTGRLGINSSTPGYGLTVSGDGYITGNLGVVGTSTLGVATISSSTIGSLNISNNVGITGLLSVTGNSSFGTIASGTWNGTAISNVYGGTGQNSSGWNGFVKVTAGTWSTSTISTNDLSNSSTLAFLANDQTFAGANTFNATSTFSTTTIFNGRVGIGTSTPSSKLQVYGGTLLVNAPVNPTIMGSVVSSTALPSAADFEVVGKFGYAVGGSGANSRFTILDLSVPSTPAIISAFSDTAIFGNPSSMKVVGRYAYVGSGVSSTFVILDVSNPHSVQLVGSLSGINGAVVGVLGRYAYVIGTGVMKVVDISNPTAPTIVGSLSDVTFSQPKNIYIKGKFAYITEDSGIEIVDISNPRSPSLKGYGTGINFAQGIDISGNYAYVMSGTGVLTATLNIFDISNPDSTPISVVGAVTDSNIAAFNHLYKVKVAGNYAYLSGSNYLVVVDITNKTNPVIVADFTDGTLTGSYAFQISGKYGYVFNINNQVTVIELNGADISSANIGAVGTDRLTVWNDGSIGNNLYINNGLNVGIGGILSNGSFAVTVSSTNGSDPFFTVGTNSTSSVLSVLGSGTVNVNGNLGVGTTTPSEKMQLYNGTLLVDSPTTPTLLGTTAFSGSPNVWSVYVSGKYGYAITTNGFETLNLDNKSAPSALAHLALTNVSAYDRSLFVSGNYAYATAGTTNTLYIVDVSNPASPSLLTTLQDNSLLTGATDVYVSGNFAYVTANSTSTVSIVDIANPYSIRVVGHVTDATKLNSATGIYVSGHYAYAVGYGNNYLVVIDVTDPANPAIVGSVTDGTNMNGPKSVYVSGKYAYVASSVSKSVAVVDISSPTAPFVAGSLVDATNLDSISSIMVAGKYAYVAAPVTSGRLSVVDISVSSSPRFIGNITDSNINGARSVFISGKYAYVASAIQSANFSVIDIKGADINAATIGNVSSNALTVWENVDVGNNLFVRSSVNIGGSLETNGPVAIAANLSNGSFFKISSSTNSAIFNISSNGNVSINTSSFGGTSYKLKIDAGGTGNGAIGVNGFIKATAYITATTTLDLAETYPINTNCLAGGNCPSDGDLVCVDSSIVSGVKKCSNGEVEKMVGIVSTEPGFLLGGGETLDSAQNEGKVKVALAGRVPTKVSAVNGSISPGDKLTLSNIDGVAAKAVGEVPIVGVAMEAFSGSGQGTIVAFVDLGWQNQLYKVLTLDTNSSTLNLGTNLLPYNFNLSGDFTMSNSALNKLIFDGVAQFDSKTLDTHAFIFNAENFGTSTDSYLLSLRSNNDPRFSVMANGDVRTNGSIYAASAIFGTSTNPGDLAERVDISTDENVEPGDVMSIDMDNSDTYRRSSAAYSETVAGVISTNPTIVVGNGKTKNTAVMAMVGRVPIKVSSENGLVKKGDLLVTATLPGYAMRYDSNKDKGLRTVSVIGLALEDMASGETGKIMALVRTGWINNNTTALVAMKGDLQKLAGSQGVALDPNQSLNIQNVGGSLTYGSGNLNLQGNQLFNVSSIIGKNNRWFIDEQGRFITRLNTSQGDKDMYAMQSPNSEFVFSSSSQMIAGEAKVVFDQYVQEVIDGQQPIKINITLTSGEAKGIYVSEKSPQGFTVKELSDGHSNATFDWMVVATRKPEDPTNIPSVIDGLINNPSGVSIDSQNSNSSTTVSTGISLTSTSTQTPITPNTTNNNVVPSSQTLPQVDLAPVQTVVPFLVAPSQPTVQTPPTPIIPVVSASAVEASPASAPAASTPPTAPSTGTTAP